MHCILVYYDTYGIYSFNVVAVSADNLEKQQRNVTFYKRLGFNVVREAARELGGKGCAR